MTSKVNVCPYEDCWCKTQELDDEQQQVHDDHNYWKEYCPEGWVISGFTYRATATLVYLGDDNLPRMSVNIDQKMQKFISDKIKELV